MKLRFSVRTGGISGQSVVELALLLPLLVILALGVFDFSRAIQANNTIANMSREGANLAARSSISPQDIMNSLASTAGSLQMSTNGAMYVTQVTQIAGSPRVQLPQSSWGSAANGRDSRISQGNVAAKLGGITIANGESVYIFEVIYTYNSVLTHSFNPQLYSITIF